MPSLTIPDRYRPALVSLLDLDKDTRRALADSLKDAPPFYSSPQLSAWLASHVPAAQHRTSGIVEFLLSLYSVRIHLNATTTELVDDFITAMQESGDDRLRIPTTEVSSFKEDLFDLLSIEAMTINEKAANVLNESERLFHSARVLTDIRPVFGEDPTERPKAALIVHTLRLQYYDETGSKEIFFSLDGADLSVLRTVLDRAIIKEETLTSLLDVAGVAHPNTESEA